MAYARFYGPGNPEVPQCDVYVYDNVDGYLHCDNCRSIFEDCDRTPCVPAAEHHFRAADVARMAAHLREHVARGHHVPDLDEIIAEMEADAAEG